MTTWREVRQRSAVAKALERAYRPDDPGSSLDGYHYGKDIGTTVSYNQSPFTSLGFPLEVVVSIGLDGGNKIWIIAIPDLGLIFSCPYWSAEGEILRAKERRK